MSDQSDQQRTREPTHQSDQQRNKEPTSPQELETLDESADAPEVVVDDPAAIPKHRKKNPIAYHVQEVLNPTRFVPSTDTDRFDRFSRYEVVLLAGGLLGTGVLTVALDPPDFTSQQQADNPGVPQAYGILVALAFCGIISAFMTAIYMILYEDKVPKHREKYVVMFMYFSFLFGLYCSSFAIMMCYCLKYTNSVATTSYVVIGVLLAAHPITLRIITTPTGT